MFGYMSKKNKEIIKLKTEIEELKKKNKAILKESSRDYLETKEVVCENYKKDETLRNISNLVNNFEFGKNPYVLVRNIKKELDNVWKTNLVQK